MNQSPGGRPSRLAFGPDEWPGQWMARILLGVVLLLPTATRLTAGVDAWSTNGPYDERIKALGIAPSDPSTIYAAALGGIVHSDDGGESWGSPVALATVIPPEGDPDRGVVQALAVDPRDPGTVFAATAAEIWKSEDSGASWDRLTPELVPGVMTDLRALRIDPDNPSTLYALSATCLGCTGFSSAGGVLKSVDGGVTWTDISEGLLEATSGGKYLHFLVVDPNQTSTLWAGGTSGLQRSLDGGLTWSGSVLQWPVRSMIIDPLTPGTLYVGDQFGILRRSSDDGASWAEFGAFPVDGSPRSLDFLATDSLTGSRLFAATKGVASDGIYRSDDGGDTWTPVLRRPSTHRGVESLAVAATVPARVLAGTTHGGLFLSSDGGDSWRGSNTHSTVGASVDDLVVHPSRPSTMWAATRFLGVQKTLDGGLTWAPANQGLPATRIRSLAIDPATPERLYAGSDGGIYRSTDGGESWSPASEGLASTPPVWWILVDPQVPSTLYANVFYSLYKSTDGAGSWQLVPAIDVRGEMVIDPSSTNVLYLVSDEGVLKSVDSGNEWHLTGLPRQVSPLAIDPKQPSTVYAGQNGSVASSLSIFKTTDGGVTWEELPTPCASHCRWIDLLAVDPLQPNRVYAATDLGLYRSEDGGNSWTLESPELSFVLGALVFDPSRPSTRYAAGSGVLGRTDVDCQAFQCLRDDRFQVEIVWEDFQGHRGIAGMVDGATNDSGVAWFFDPGRWEALVKILDGCGYNGQLWTLAAAATNVEMVLSVTDTTTERVNRYWNPAGQSFQPVLDTKAFAACGDPESPSAPHLETPPTATNWARARGQASTAACVPGNGELCLGSGRFRVEANWRDFAGRSGTARVVPMQSEESGLFWFFAADNWELLVKVVDGCGLNGHHWVMAAGATNVEMELLVTDTLTGEWVRYFQPLGESTTPILDTQALEGCQP
ncbi:MAG: hypothetical protein K8J08_14430 [Thermoanaerobaculia bacterium]|nr:hypothetical protein [Thermoanaerobaculia bacterium]